MSCGMWLMWCWSILVKLCKLIFCGKVEFFLIISWGSIRGELKEKEELVIKIWIVEGVKGSGEKVVGGIRGIYDKGNGDKGYFNKEKNDNLVGRVKESGSVCLSGCDWGEYRFLGL